jgi:hypothetical protein
LSNGLSKRTCIDGKWNGEQPACKIKNQLKFSHYSEIFFIYWIVIATMAVTIICISLAIRMSQKKNIVKGVESVCHNPVQEVSHQVQDSVLETEHTYEEME